MSNTLITPSAFPGLPKLARLLVGAFIAGGLTAAIASADSIDSDEGSVELSVFRVEADKLDQNVADQLTTSRRLGDLTTTVPRSVVVVDRFRIEDRGAINIQDTLNYTPGVSPGPYGFDSRLDATRIRGIDPLKFQDGFQSLFGFYNNTRADIYTLEQVEAVKGPASVLYGRGALGGIVNAVTKLPQAGTRNELEIQYGSFNRTQIAGDFNGALDADAKFLFRLIGVYRDSDTQVDHVSDDARVLTPSFTWAPRDGTRLTLLGNFQENHGGQTLQFLPNEGTLLPGQRIPVNTFIGEPGWDRYDTEQESYALFFEHELNDTFTVTANTRYTDGSSLYRAHWVAYDGADPLIADDGTINRTIYDAPGSSEAFTTYGTLAARFNTGSLDHHFTVGFDAQDVTIDGDNFYGWAAGGRINIYEPVYGNLAPVGAITDYPATITNQFGIFAQERMSFENWTLALGLRYDDVRTHSLGNSTPNIDDDATTGDIGLIYQASRGFTPYVSYAESFEPLGTAIAFDGSVQQLDPKTGEQFEVGLRYQPVGTQTLFTFSAFNITEKERPLSNGLFVTQTNVGTEGFEFEVDSRWRDFRFQGGYSYVDAKDGNGNHLVTVPDHQATGWVTYEPREGALQNFRTGMGVRYVGERWDGTDTLSAPPYTLLDFMVGYDFETVRLQLNVTNATDKYYVGTTDGGRAFLGAARNIILSAKYRF
ncbi:MAG: TonB-dependent siderophore receptor [Synoicihabitans sp.]